jgi:hypothetical protein
MDAASLEALRLLKLALDEGLLLPDEHATQKQKVLEACLTTIAAKAASAPAPLPSPSPRVAEATTTSASGARGRPCIRIPKLETPVTCPEILGSKP